MPNDNQTPTQPEVQKEVDKLNNILQIEDQPLLHVTAVFPFDFFPNEVIIDRTKVTIIRKLFFWTRQVSTMLIADILNVSVRHGILFGTLVIADRFFAQDPYEIEYLWKAQATQTASIIQGLILAGKENIDVMKIPTHQLTTQIEQAGIPTPGRDTDSI